MDGYFMEAIDQFREDIGVSMSIHCGYATEGHAENSYHYLGRAIDFHFEEEGRRLSLEEHILLALRSPFGGIGIYTWSPNGPFLHFDNRKIEGARKIWICENQGIYRNLGLSFLRSVFKS